MLSIVHGRRRTTAIAAALLCLLAATGPLQSAADQIADKQTQRAQLNLTMDDLHRQISTAQDQQVALQKIIDGVNASIVATSHLVDRAQARLAEITTALSDAETQLAETRARLVRDREQLRKAMVLTFKFDKDATALGSLVSSGDFNEFFGHFLAARKVSSAESEIVTAVTTEEQTVRDQVATVAAAKLEQAKALAGLRAQVTALDGELVSRENAKALLRQLQASDEQRLRQAEQSARDLDNEIAQLKAAKARAEAEARRRAAEAAAAAAAAARNHGGGHPVNTNVRFSWPEAGDISQGYGCTGFPFEPPPPAGIHCSSGHFHTGIDIAAPGGTAVGAADSGIVFTFASSYGYGNHIIMVHAGGWVSVYGHLASFAVGNGAGVGRGQTIGYEGSSGNSTGPHLHFEIRLNDVVENPLNYLP